MQIGKRYAYSTGLGVGLIMGLSSIFATFLFDNWLDKGGLAMVVFLDILVGMTVGTVLTYIVHKII